MIFQGVLEKTQAVILVHLIHKMGFGVQCGACVTYQHRRFSDLQEVLGPGSPGSV